MKKCKVCGNIFTPLYYSTERYCSPSCAYADKKPIRQISSKSLKKIKQDEVFYERLYKMHFKNGSLSCQECGVELDPRFRDESGKIVERWRYSHRISKGAREDLRHDINNANILCLKHHQQWESGKRKLMKIYE